MSQQQKLEVIRAELERAETYRRLLYSLPARPTDAIKAISAHINALQDAYCKQALAR